MTITTSPAHHKDCIHALNPDSSDISKRPTNAHDDLVYELIKAHRIIAHMLTSMTPKQQAKLAIKLDDLGLSEFGATRHHERVAALSKFGGAI